MYESVNPSDLVAVMNSGVGVIYDDRLIEALGLQDVPYEDTGETITKWCELWGVTWYAADEEECFVHRAAAQARERNKSFVVMETLASSS